MFAARLAPGTISAMLFGALGAGIGLVVPLMYIKRRTARRHTALEGQLAEFCDLTSSMLASGYGYLQAMTHATEQVGPPLGQELRQFLDAVRVGADIDEALEQLNEHLGSTDFDIVATAVQIQRRTGGNLGEILRGAAATIRERQSFRREIAALTSRERYSAAIVAGFPVLLALGLAALMPATFGRLFTEVPGRIMLTTAFAMDFVGYMAIRRVARLEV
jgi:tight adherence protein B